MKRGLTQKVTMKWHDWLLLISFGIIVALAWTDLAYWLGIEEWVR